MTGPHFFLYSVRLWLGDQAEYYVGSIVAGISPADAIAKARREVVFAWPMLLPHIRDSPAHAVLLSVTKPTAILDPCP